MSYFKFKSINFKNFIENSRAKLENSLYGYEDESDSRNCLAEQVSVENRILKNLDILTHDEKIIWSADSEVVFRGVVVENCALCDYKIIICKNQIGDSQKFLYNSDHSSESFVVSFIKGILTIEKIEYFIDPYDMEHNLLAQLIGTINKKLLQQKN